MAKPDVRKFDVGDQVEYYLNGESCTGVVDGVRYNEDSDGIRHSFRYVINHPVETQEEFDARIQAIKNDDPEFDDSGMVIMTRELSLDSSQLQAI